MRIVSLSAVLLLSCLFCSGQVPLRGPSKWEQELNSAVAQGRLPGASELKLTGYQYFRTLDDKDACERMLYEIMRKDAVCVNPEKVSPEFSILFLCRRKKGTDETTETIRLEDIVKPGMKAVDLWWEYRGQMLTSIAIVSDRGGVIYDNIGTNTIEVQKDRKVTYLDQSGMTALRRIRLTDGFGRELVSCLLCVQTTFGGDGVLKNVKEYNDSHAAEQLGWECRAELKIYGTPEVSEYAIAHATVHYGKRPYEYRGYLLGGKQFDEEAFYPMVLNPD